MVGSALLLQRLAWLGCRAATGFPTPPQPDKSGARQLPHTHPDLGGCAALACVTSPVARSATARFSGSNTIPRDDVAPHINFCDAGRPRLRRRRPRPRYRRRVRRDKESELDIVEMKYVKRTDAVAWTQARARAHFGEM